MGPHSAQIADDAIQYFNSDKLTVQCSDVLRVTSDGRMIEIAEYVLCCYVNSYID